MAADTASLPEAKNSRYFECEYQNFCNAGKPIRAVLFSIAFVYASIVIISVIEGRTHNYLLFDAQSRWIADHGGVVGYTLPAAIVAFRGRKSLKPILIGKLSFGKMVIVGISVGCLTTYLSAIVGEKYFYLSSWQLSGFFEEINAAVPLSSYLLAPFGEEMFYQVGLQTWLQRFGPIVSVLGATAPFWLSHLYLKSLPIALALIWILPGLFAYALIRQITKSTGAAIIAHSTYNILCSILPLYPR